MSQLSCSTDSRRFYACLFVCVYSHVQRMAEGRLHKIALKWMPKQKRARGRPKKNWMEGIRKAMNERNLNEGQWGDRKQWSPGVGQRRKIVDFKLSPCSVCCMFSSG